MTCLPPRELARAAMSADAETPHLGDCLRCRREVQDQRALHAVARRLPPAPLSRGRRERLAAAILAEAELTPARPARTAPRQLALAAAAAAVVITSGLLGPAVHDALRGRAKAEAPGLTFDDHVTAPSREVARLELPPPLPPARIALATARTAARATHAVRDGRDVLTLTDGEIEIDSRGTRDAVLQIADTQVVVDAAQIRVRARHGEIQRVQVIVGAAEIITPARRIRVEPEHVWWPEPSNLARSTRAFRDAWTVLRSGDAAAALALFDRADAPAVAEDAAFWGAIAARRAGQLALAHDRLVTFLARFPHSPHAAHARALLDAP